MKIATAEKTRDIIHFIAMDSNYPFDKENVRPIDLTTFEIETLLAIAKVSSSSQEVNGLRILDELQIVYGKDINNGQVYNTINKLVGLGLITKSEIDKRANEYKLTEDAIQLLERYQTWIARHTNKLQSREN